MKTLWTNQRERVAEWGLLRTISYYIFGVAAHKLAGIWFMDSFEWPDQPVLPSTSAAEFALLESMSDWTDRDRELLNTHQGITLSPLFPGFFAAGDKCAVARYNGGELACVCWIHPTSDYPLARNMASFVIQYCFTLPEWRGKGLYPQTLAFACKSLRSRERTASRLFVDCSSFNYASKRGILKAGFQPAGWILKAFRRTWAWPRHFRPRQPVVIDAT
jgi:hypothetical protein